MYLHSLVGHVVNLCFSHHDQVWNNVVQILYSMIVSEYHQWSENFDEIKNELVTRLDFFVYARQQKWQHINRHFHWTPSVSFQYIGCRWAARFLNSVDLFLKLLLSIHALPDGEEYANDCVIAMVCRPHHFAILIFTFHFCTVETHEFYLLHWARWIYIKYVHQLAHVGGVV